jgi:multiple sugar transport system substrate-binding protein
MKINTTKVWSAAIAVSLTYTAAYADGHTADVYAPYAGTTLVVNFPAHPHYNAVLDVLPEFTEQTGIEVEVDQLQYLKMRERL